MDNKFFKKDLGGAIFLLFIGTIFLLNTTGVVHWDIWLHILKFWPVFLILGGLRLVLEGTKITEIIMTVVTFFAYLAVGFLAYSSYTSQNVSFLPSFIINMPDVINPEFKKEETLAVLQESYKNVEKRILDIDIAASKATITDDKETNYLEVDGSYDEQYVKPVVQSNLKERELTILFDTQISRERIYWGQNNMEFNLFVGQPSLLTDISLSVGAGDTALTFDKLLLDTVSTRVGAGKLLLALSDLSIPKEIKLEVGAGEMILQIPEEIGYEINYSLGIGEITADGEEIAVFAGKGTSYKSSNYETSTKKILIDAKVGVGRLSIVNN